MSRARDLSELPQGDGDVTVDGDLITNGNVGIGTSAPFTPLTVNGRTVVSTDPVRPNGDFVTSFQSNGVAAGGRELFEFGRGGYVTNGNEFVNLLLAPSIGDNTRNAGWYQEVYRPRTTTGNGNYFAIGQIVRQSTGATQTERLRIDSIGNLLVGTTNIPIYLQTSGSGKVTRASGETYISRQSDAALWLNRNTAIGAMLMFYYGASLVGNVSTNGTAVSYNTSSDYRLKEDVQPVDNAVERLKQLKPVNFAWKADGTRVDGFLAHEAQEVVPEAVTGTKDAMRIEEYEVSPAVLDEDGNVLEEAVMGEREVPEYQGIDQAKLVPLLTAALQDAVAKIESLEQRIQALEGKEL